MDKMTIYNAVRSVPQNAQRKIQGGHLNGKTDINPVWRIKTLTEQFGPVGFGWYTEITKYWIEEAAGETCAWVQLNLYVQVDGQWSKPIQGVGGSKQSGKGRGDGINEEAYKMAETDALSVACKKMGVAADIYWEADSTKYSAAPAPAPASKAAPKPAPAPAPQQGTLPGAKTCSKEMWDAYVQKEANGERLKSGKTAKQGWIDTFHPSEEEIKKFDAAVRAAFLEDLHDGDPAAF